MGKTKNMDQQRIIKIFIYTIPTAIVGVTAYQMVKEFLKNELSLAEGVKLPLIQGLEWKYATFPFAPIGEWKVPEAGYFKIETGDLTINYLPYVLD